MMDQRPMQREGGGGGLARIASNHLLLRKLE